MARTGIQDSLDGTHERRRVRLTSQWQSIPGWNRAGELGAGDRRGVLQPWAALVPLLSGRQCGRRQQAPVQTPSSGPLRCC